jgi:hypothetical protein
MTSKTSENLNFLFGSRVEGAFRAKQAKRILFGYSRLDSQSSDLKVSIDWSVVIEAM